MCPYHDSFPYPYILPCNNSLEMLLCLEMCPYHDSFLFRYPLQDWLLWACHVIVTSQLLQSVVCPLESRHGNVFCLLSCQWSSGFWPYILFQQVSQSQLWSASISLSIYIYCHNVAVDGSISRGLIFIPPMHMSNPSQPLLS